MVLPCGRRDEVVSSDLRPVLPAGCGLRRPNVPRRHPLQDAVPYDQRVDDSIPQPTSGRTNINPYIVSSDAVAARRSRRDIVPGNGGGGLSRRFTKRTTTRIRMAIPSGRWMDTSAW